MTLWEYAAAVDGWVKANGGKSASETISDHDYERLVEMTQYFNGGK